MDGDVITGADGNNEGTTVKIYAGPAPQALTPVTVTTAVAVPVTRSIVSVVLVPLQPAPETVQE